MSFFSFSKSKEAKSALVSKSERIILTTLDINRDYEILDIIWSDEIHLDVNFDYTNQKNILKQKAAEIGADAVIGVRMFLCNIDGRLTNSGNRRWYGTAVKFK